MKLVKIVVDILMLIFLVLSLLRWSGDPTFHIIVGGIFIFLFIIHFILNAKMFIKMSEKFIQYKIKLKLQYIVDSILILIWVIVTILGVLAAINYLGNNPAIINFGRLHGVLGRVGCGFIGIHIIQHIKQIHSYFKVKNNGK